MPFATMFHKHHPKAPGVCADCGQPLKTSLSASNSSMQREYVCPSCMMWRKTAGQFRGGFWGALLTRRAWPQH
jgi:hypothetical protein